MMRVGMFDEVFDVTKRPRLGGSLPRYLISLYPPSRMLVSLLLLRPARADAAAPMPHPLRR